MRLGEVKKTWLVRILLFVVLVTATWLWVDFLRDHRLKIDTKIAQESAAAAIKAATEAASNQDNVLKQQIQDLTNQVSELQKKLDTANSNVSKMQESLKALGVARDFQ